MSTAAPAPAASAPAASSAPSAPRPRDAASRAWLLQLQASGPARDVALGRLHALLLREARYEVRRRAAGLRHPSGRDLDDLAVQAADDALVAILGKLNQFRGDALFTTWARRFVALEVPGVIRRRRGRAGETPADPEQWLSELARGEDPFHHSEVSELADTVGRLIAEELTEHQRDVLVALAVRQVEPKRVAAQLGCTRGAVYKTLHDARRKLRQGLEACSAPGA